MIKTGDHVTQVRYCPEGYVGKPADVLKVDGRNAIIEWTETDGSRTATWTPVEWLAPSVTAP